MSAAPTPAIHDPSKDPIEQDRDTVRVLRYLIRMTVAAALATCVLAFVPVILVDGHYREHEGRAGGVSFAMTVLLLVAPALWVDRDPRWRRLGGWMLWVALGGTMAIRQLITLESGAVETVPIWPRAVMFIGLGLVGLIVLLLLPCMRHFAKSPEPAPEARIHRDRPD